MLSGVYREAGLSLEILLSSRLLRHSMADHRSAQRRLQLQKSARCRLRAGLSLHMCQARTVHGSRQPPCRLAASGGAEGGAPITSMAARSSSSSMSSAADGPRAAMKSPSAVQLRTMWPNACLHTAPGSLHPTGWMSPRGCRGAAGECAAGSAVHTSVQPASCRSEASADMHCLDTDRRGAVYL